MKYFFQSISWNAYFIIVSLHKLPINVHDILFEIKSILIHEYQHKSTRVNTNQHESTRINTNQHGSNTSEYESDTSQYESNTTQHESGTSQHESTRVNTSPKQVLNKILLKI